MEYKVAPSYETGRLKVLTKKLVKLSFPHSAVNVVELDSIQFLVYVLHAMELVDFVKKLRFIHQKSILNT